MYKNCVYLKQKMNRTLFCKKQNKIINIGNCKSCKFKHFPDIEKMINKTIKKSSHKSKLTKATSITKSVKLTVWERDNHQCIFCKKYVEWNYANSHYIKRSHGGLGIEQNIMTNCDICHKLFEESIHREEMKLFAKKHFMSKYDNWNEDNLIYKKFSTKF